MSVTRGAPAAAAPAAAPDLAAAAPGNDRAAASSGASATDRLAEPYMAMAASATNPSTAAGPLVTGAGPKGAVAPPGSAGPLPITAAAPPCLPLFRRGAWYDSRDREPVLAAPGSALLSHAPPVMLRDDAAWFRRWSPPRPLPSTPPAPVGRPPSQAPPTSSSQAPATSPPAPGGAPAAAQPWRPHRAERERMVARAMDLFATAAVEAGGAGTQTAADFERALDAHCGLPPALTRRWTALLASQAARLAAAADASDELPEGTLALVSLPANTFVCLESVLDLALRGAAVWVRPSRREPFAALRLVACLLAAGWPPPLLGFYPTARQTLGTLVRLVDLAVLYGGPELAVELQAFFRGPATDVPAATGVAAARGATAGRPRLEIHGPGRARAVVAASCTASAAVEPLLELVAGDAGRFCTSAGTILCTHSAEEIGRELAERLDALPLGPLDAIGPMEASEPIEVMEAIANIAASEAIAAIKPIESEPMIEAAGPIETIQPTRRAGGAVAAVAAATAEGRWPWPLAACPEESLAEATVGWIAERLRPGDRFLTHRPLLQRSGGRTLLAPALVALASPAGHPLLGIELPFPFAVIAAVTRGPDAFGRPNTSCEPGASGESAGSGESKSSGKSGGAADAIAGVPEELLRGARFIYILGAGGARSLEVRIPGDTASTREPGAGRSAAPAPSNPSTSSIRGARP
jgi:hypothetical protein